jgi:Ran GTPase-activating protein (RanGAP) involved in mRNA processing and transport
MGALTRLDISKNKLFHQDGAPAGKALGGMLAVNSTLQELDVSDNAEWPSSKGGSTFAQALSVGISDNGSLTQFDISSNSICAKGGKVLAEALKGNQAITELNITDNKLGLDRRSYGDMSGVLAVANAISDMEAILSVNFLQNNIDIGQAGALASMLKGHPTLKSLCGNKGGETELDMSSKKLDASDAIMLATEIVGNGALTKLNISTNRIGEHYARNGNTDGAQALSAAIKGKTSLKELNLSSNGFKGGGAKLLADGILGNGTLTTVIMHTFPLPIEDIKTNAELDLSGNGLVCLDAIVLAALLPLNVS